MAMILTRQQFSEHFNSLQKGLGEPGSYLWNPEEHLAKNRRFWFICVRPINLGDFNDTLVFRKWCQESLTSSPVCYNSNNDEQQEWWGFKNRNDIMLWMLRWV